MREDQRPKDQFMEQIPKYVTLVLIRQKKGCIYSMHTYIRLYLSPSMQVVLSLNVRRLFLKWK
jgi:hypothetical protein